MKAFRWKVYNRINEMIKSKIHDNIGQNIFDKIFLKKKKEKTALDKIIRAKNNTIVIYDTEIKMSAADADKKTWFLNAQDNYQILKHI